MPPAVAILPATNASHADNASADVSPSEARVVRQLIEALLFERLLPHELSSRAIAPLTLRGKSRALRCRARLGAFDRVRIAENSITLAATGAPARLDDALDLLDALDADPARLDRLKRELAHTVTLCEWNRQNLPEPAPRRRLGYVELEAALTEGHLYHPCFKSRTGFSLADHACYGPESAGNFRVHWLAARRDRVTQALPSAEDVFWTRELGAEGFAELRRRLVAEGAAPADYVFLPMHPWQFGNLRGDLIAPDLAARSLISLGEAGDTYQATQSVRTLFNTTHRERANLKLPMNLTNTSSLRSLEAHSVCSAPEISDWIHRTVAHDPYLADEQRLIVLREYAGLLYDPHLGARAEGQVACIFRESLFQRLRLGETATPFSALALAEPDGAPFVRDWLDRHGVERWLRRLFEVAVVPVWHLLAAHGIALEAHAQNLVLVHRDGWPVRLAVRDFHDSVEFVPAFLGHTKFVPDFARLNPLYRDAPDDLYHRMAETDALFELFTDTVYVYNLAELSHLLERHGVLAEATFWSWVAEAVAAHARNHPDLAGRLARLAPLRPTLRAESLLRKKLGGDSSTVHFHRLANPFAASAAPSDYHAAR